MLDRDKLKQYGKPKSGKWLGITIHNTGNELSAKEMFDYLNTENKSSQGCHYFVDEKEAVKVMPLNWITWHTGKADDYGNLNTIAIEICRSQCDDETYLKAQERAVELVKDLLDQYGLGIESVFFHNEFNERAYCPHRIYERYRTKRNWIKEVFK